MHRDLMNLNKRNTYIIDQIRKAGNTEKQKSRAALAQSGKRREGLTSFWYLYGLLWADFNYHSTLFPFLTLNKWIQAGLFFFSFGKIVYLPSYLFICLIVSRFYQRFSWKLFSRTTLLGVAYSFDLLTLSRITLKNGLHIFKILRWEHCLKMFGHFWTLYVKRLWG